MGAAYVECSSKELTGVDEVFELAVNTAVGIEEKGWEGYGLAAEKSGGGGSGLGIRKGKFKKRTCKVL